MRQGAWRNGREQCWRGEDREVCVRRKGKTKMVCYSASFLVLQRSSGCHGLRPAGSWPRAYPSRICL